MSEGSRKSGNKRGSNRGILRQYRAKKREEAEARQAERKKRPDRHQLAVLKRRPGRSKREVARLQKRANKERRRERK